LIPRLGPLSQAADEADIHLVLGPLANLLHFLALQQLFALAPHRQAIFRAVFLSTLGHTQGERGQRAGDFFHGSGSQRERREHRFQHLLLQPTRRIEFHGEGLEKGRDMVELTRR
jgi:hypothetical protein